MHVQGLLIVAFGFVVDVLAVVLASVPDDDGVVAVVAKHKPIRMLLRPQLILKATVLILVGILPLVFLRCLYHMLLQSFRHIHLLPVAFLVVVVVGGPGILVPHYYCHLQ